MAAPNLVSPTTITGKTVSVAAVTGGVAVLNNAAASGKCLKVNSLIASNVDGTNAATVTITRYAEDDGGGTGYNWCEVVNVPAGTAIVIIDKNSYMYLEEDMSLYAVASADGDIEVHCGYEEIS